MKTMRILIPAVLLSMLFIPFTACEKDIDIFIPINDTLLVVDGTVENNEFAKVTVTRSVPYFQTINLSDLQNIFVGNAKVWITDGVLTDTLQFTFDPNEFPPLLYRGTNPALKGQEGKTYYLTVVAEGDTLTAQTTIPPVVYLDSIYWKPDGQEQDSLGFGWGHIKDPDTLGNIYRMFVKRQDYQFYVPARPSTLDDRIINGQSTAFNFIRPRPLPSYLTPDTVQSNPDERRYFKRGDTMYVKFCSIDKISYDYIRTYEAASGSFGNPFSAPGFVKSNIKGGLGGFVGYGASYYMYVIPKN